MGGDLTVRHLRMLTLDAAASLLVVDALAVVRFGFRLRERKPRSSSSSDFSSCSSYFLSFFSSYFLSFFSYYFLSFFSYYFLSFFSYYFLSFFSYYFLSFF